MINKRICKDKSDNDDITYREHNYHSTTCATESVTLHRWKKWREGRGEGGGGGVGMDQPSYFIFLGKLAGSTGFFCPGRQTGLSLCKF